MVPPPSYRDFLRITCNNPPGGHCESWGGAIARFEYPYLYQSMLHVIRYLPRLAYKKWPRSRGNVGKYSLHVAFGYIL